MKKGNVKKALNFNAKMNNVNDKVELIRLGKVTQLTEGTGLNYSDSQFGRWG